jgi:hypothetical protein
MFQKQKNPCNICIVKGCCEKREDECQLLLNWKHRNDWMKTLFGSIFIIPLAIFAVIASIICRKEIKESMSLFLDDEYY